MTPTRLCRNALISALGAHTLGAPALVVALGVALLAVLIGIAVVVAAKQGRADVTINISLGRSRREPP
jgi:hypothetical protein